jgi:hypothetical protein
MSSGEDDLSGREHVRGSEKRADREIPIVVLERS